MATRISESRAAFVELKPTLFKFSLEPGGIELVAPKAPAVNVPFSDLHRHDRGGESGEALHCREAGGAVLMLDQVDPQNLMCTLCLDTKNDDVFDLVAGQGSFHDRGEGLAGGDADLR